MTTGRPASTCLLMVLRLHAALLAWTPRARAALSHMRPSPEYPPWLSRYASIWPGLMALPEILLTAMEVAVMAQPAALMLQWLPSVRPPHCASPWRYMGVPSAEVGY